MRNPDLVIKACIRVCNPSRNQWWALAQLPLTRTKKGGARRSGSKVLNSGAMAVARRKSGDNLHHFHAILGTRVGTVPVYRPRALTFL